MNFRYLITLTLLAGLAVAPAAHADTTEAVTHYAETASLDRSGVMTITDQIDYDFGSAAPHSIQFSIPVSYHDDQGNEFRLNFDLQNASLDGKLITLNPTVSAATVAITLPAGSSPTSVRTYELNYTLAPIIIKGATRDILQRSVTGAGWTVPINRATLRLDTHKTAGDNFTCIVGNQGSTTGACEIKQNGEQTTVDSYAPLKPGEGMSIYTDFHPGSFTSYLKAYQAPQSYLWLGIILGAIVVAAVSIKIRLLYNKTHGNSENQAQRD